MDYLQKQRLDDLFFEADTLIKERKITEAISTLEAILVEAPDYGRAYNHLAWIFETQYREYAKAEDFYKKCIALDPNYTPAYLNLSINLSTLGKYQEQLHLLESALNIPGIDKAGMYNEMAIAKELMGEYIEAMAFYREAIRYTLSDANLTTYSGSIERCRKKEELLR